MKRCFGRTYDQDGQTSCTQNALGNAAQHPVLEAGPAMRGHRDHVAAPGHASALGVFSALRHVNNVPGDVIIQGNRPGHRQGKLSRWAFSQVSDGTDPDGPPAGYTFTGTGQVTGFIAPARRA